MAPNGTNHSSKDCYKIGFLPKSLQILVIKNHVKRRGEDERIGDMGAKNKQSYKNELLDKISPEHGHTNCCVKRLRQNEGKGVMATKRKENRSQEK